MPAAQNTPSILVVAESALCRKFLTDAIALIPGAMLAGVAANAAIARQKLALREANLILLSLGAGEGFATFHALRKAFPEIGIIITGTIEKERVHAMVRAMQAGALHFLPQPERFDLPESGAGFSRDLLPLLRHCTLQLTLRQTELAPFPSPDRGQVASRTMPRSGTEPAPVDLIAIAVSTGGPAALSEVLPRLPGDLGVPVLIVQHMPAVFTASLAESLDAKSLLAVKEAGDGELVLPNTVYIAPGGRHMIVRRGRETGSSLEIALTDAPPVKSCRPSADVLFQSVAEELEGHVLAVVLTGMGEDGAEGVRLLKERSCYCLSQSRETCVVYGMPRAIEIGGLADEVLPLEDIATRIVKLVKGCPR